MFSYLSFTFILFWIVFVLFLCCVVYYVVCCILQACFISSCCSIGVLDLQNEYVCMHVYVYICTYVDYFVR